MRLDHIAYRVSSKEEALYFFQNALGYYVDPDLPNGFDIQFEDGSQALCLALVPPESKSTCKTRNFFGQWGIEAHAAPEIFVSEGSTNSIVAAWVEAHGPGIHHLAYEVNSVEQTMHTWRSQGIQFASDKPLTCPGLVQVFTTPHPVTGLIYELIERDTHGFCKDNVKDLMKSTRGKDAKMD